MAHPKEYPGCGCHLNKVVNLSKQLFGHENVESPEENLTVQKLREKPHRLRGESLANYDERQSAYILAFWGHELGTYLKGLSYIEELTQMCEKGEFRDGKISVLIREPHLERVYAFFKLALSDFDSKKLRNFSTGLYFKCNVREYVVKMPRTDQEEMELSLTSRMLFSPYENYVTTAFDLGYDK